MLTTAFLVMMLAVHQDWKALASPAQDVDAPFGMLPKYLQAEARYNEFLADIRKRFPTASRNLIALAGVISGISREMTTANWTEYHEVYEKRMSKFFEGSLSKPEKVISEIDCVISHNDIGIKNILRVLRNPNVKSFCNSFTIHCDTLISAVIDAQEFPPLKDEAKRLLLLGQFTKQYLKILPKLTANDNANLWDLRLWLMKSKDLLAPLIQSLTEIRQLAPKNPCSPKHQ